VRTARSSRTPKSDRPLKLNSDDFIGCAEADIDYDETHEDGCPGSYCGCSKIVSVEIRRVSIDSVIYTAQEALKKYIGTVSYRDGLFGYFVDRIVTHSKLRVVDYWSYKVSRGYYGEECTVFPNEDVVSELASSLLSLAAQKSLKGKIKLVLKYEYGYILDEVESANSWTLESIKIQDVIMGALHHYKKLDRSIVHRYKNYDLPRCVVMKRGEKFAIIDGYHRLHSAKNSGEKKIKAFVGE